MRVINADKALLWRNALFPRFASPQMLGTIIKVTTNGLCNGANSGSATASCDSESMVFTGKNDRMQDTAPTNSMEHLRSLSSDRKKGPRNNNISRIANHPSSTRSIPSLKKFLHWQRVIHQYRHFLKAIANIDDPKWRNQLRSDVRKGYKDVIGSTDSIVIQMALKEGDVRLKQLHSIICYDSTTNEAKRKLQPEEKAGELSSWIHLNNEEDQRGRVGIDWPWNKN